MNTELNIAKRYKEALAEVSDMKQAIDNLEAIFIKESLLKMQYGNDNSSRISDLIDAVRPALANICIEDPSHTSLVVEALHNLSVLVQFMSVCEDYLPFQKYIEYMKLAIERAEVLSIRPSDTIEQTLKGEITL